MKTTKTTLAAALMAVMVSTSAFATGENHGLSDAEWQAIEEETVMEDMLNIEALPALRTVSVKQLEMNFLPTRQMRIELSAPFGDAEQIGMVVVDANGNVVQSTSGTYGKLKNLKLAAYYNTDMVYVVRLYSADAVYETKLQVVNL